jgi:cell division protease FtsH
MISAILGGRAAEDIFFNEFTSGASNDIEKATKIARKMVTEYGMSNLGPISYSGYDEEKRWLAKQVGEYHKQSEEMAARIDKEVEKIIDTAYKRAKDILKGKKELMEKISNKLLEKETLTQDEFGALLSE